MKVSVWKLQQTQQNLCNLQPTNLVCVLIPLAIPNLRGQHSCGVMISSQVEGDNNKGPNPGGTPKSPRRLAGNPKKQWQGAGLWHLWLVGAILPEGSCSHQLSGPWSAQVTVRPYRVKPWFGGFLGWLGWGFFSVVMPRGQSFPRRSRVLLLILIWESLLGIHTSPSEVPAQCKNSEFNRHSPR